jgi:NADH-quinone oxidoreductase subunit L
MMLGSSPPGTCISARRKCRRRLAERHSGLYKFLLNKWYFDELYDFLFVKPAMWVGRKLWKKGDGDLIDGFGPDGVAARVQK